MRLEPGEVPGLPLPAALVDHEGREVSATPEWTGPCPGTVSFHTGHGHLLVAPDAPAPELDALMARLLLELTAAAGRLAGEEALRVSVLAAALELVAGRPVGGQEGTVDDVVALVGATLPARTQGLALQVEAPVPAARVPAPAAVALALVQLAVNARRHDGAESMTLSVTPGPTFLLEWPAGPAGAAAVRSHRHALRRERWGWGYVQMVADALGGSALPPGAARGGRDRAGLGLGSVRLALPLACVRDGRVERATQAWEQEAGAAVLGRPAGGSLAGLVAEAALQPGRIAYRDLYRARLRRDRTWVALAPESGSSRAGDVLRGLQHERALWTAPEPHATRVSALSTLLRVAMGEPWPSVPPGLHAEGLTAACAALGVEPPAAVDGLCPPEPRVTAFLLAELGGHLAVRGEEVYLVPAASRAGCPLLQALGGVPDGCLRINP
ncbi:MAG TPA: hypothetical protein VKF59_18630 [Candidatus Dormibacteraeota bacterium]|nr:hypothetical protein [Candidatus Dormibacteraeota bacterium]